MAIDGPKIIDSDLAADIEEEFFERFDAGMTPAAIETELNGEYAAETLSTVDREILLTTLAECLWSVGTPTDHLAEQLQEMLDRQATAEFWQEMYAERERVLRRFLKKLQTPKKKPLQPRKRRSPRRHLFADGDYLIFTKRNAKRVLVIMWGAERIGGLTYAFVLPNLTRTNDADLLRRLLITDESITDAELATFFSKNMTVKSIGIEHRLLKPHAARFQRIGNRPMSTNVWRGSSFGSCVRFEDLERYIDEGGSRGLTFEELKLIGITT